MILMRMRGAVRFYITHHRRQSKEFEGHCMPIKVCSLHATPTSRTLSGIIFSALLTWTNDAPFGDRGSLHVVYSHKLLARKG